MSSGYSDPGRARPRCRFMVNRLRRSIFIAAAAATLLGSAVAAEAASFRQGVSAFNRQEYLLASQNFFPLAEQGDPAAQTYLGFMFETGRGVPKNYTEAAMWYRRAADRATAARNIRLVCRTTLAKLQQKRPAFLPA